MIKKENNKIVIKVQKTKCNSCGKINEYLEHKPITCKFCDIPYFEKPLNEIKLFILQDEYLNNGRDSIVLGKMAIIMSEIFKNLIIKKLKNSRKLHLEDIEDKVSESLEKILNYYLTKPNFRIDNSFTGYLEQVVLYPLYNKKIKDQEKNEISMESILENVNHSNNDNNISSETLNLKYNISGSSECKDHDDGTDNTNNFSLNSLFKYSSDEYMLDYAGIDFVIDSICKAIEALLNLTLKNYGLKEALVQNLFFYHYFGKMDKKFYNELSNNFGCESTNKFKYIVDIFKISFHQFEKTLLILRNKLFEDIK
jgi:hypothetical protein